MKNYIQREENYDLLRVICTIAVISIHVSATYKTAITDPTVFGKVYDEYWVTILLYNMLTRFAVPCFVMLTGAFLLYDERNSDYIYFYKKSMKKIGIPTIVFSVFYFLYSELLKIVGIFYKGNSITSLIIPIKELLKGAPFPHLWYLYTLGGIYLLIPIVINVKRNISKDNGVWISIFLLIFTSISGWTSSFEINWSISKSICYLGYLLIGYELRIFYVNRKNNKRGVFLIAAGVIIELILTYFQYMHCLRGLAESDEKLSLVGNFNPLVVSASVLIFAGFSNLNIKFVCSKLASKTFYIYLFHEVVWSILSQVVLKIGLAGDARLIIPVSIVFIFGVSYILSILYVFMWNRIMGLREKKHRNI